MKTVDIRMLDRHPGRRIQNGETFAFECRPDLACFNRCCRNLNLFLYPYDVLRLKNALGMHSSRFLDRHVDVVLRPGHHFPDLLLRMTDHAHQSCPFVTPSGCSVYADRPGTCRLFPAERGRYFDTGAECWRTVTYFRPPSFCLGIKTEKTWTADAWAANQKSGPYHDMTIRWADLVARFDDNTWGAEGPEGSRAKMTFMAVYNLDAFRDFIFNSSFLKRYRLNPGVVGRIKKDDASLLRFGFEWVRFFLWGQSASMLRPR